MAAGSIAVGGFVVGVRPLGGTTHHFENAAATARDHRPQTLSTDAAGSVRSGHSCVRPTGTLSVLRGSAAAGLAAECRCCVRDRLGESRAQRGDRRAGARDASAGENDPLRPQQWALDQTSFEKAWSATRGAGVTVAVIDTGVDAAHQDLGSVVLPGIDYVDPGRDGRYDPDGHGTHVAGIIAARVEQRSSASPARRPSVHILPVRVLDANGSGVSSNVAPGSSGPPTTARGSST